MFSILHRSGLLRCSDSEFIGNHLAARCRAMAQAVSHRLLTAEDRVRNRSVHIGFVVDNMTLGQVFLRVLRFYLVSIMPPRPLRTSISSGGWTIGPLVAAVLRPSLTLLTWSWTSSSRNNLWTGVRPTVRSLSTCMEKNNTECDITHATRGIWVLKRPKDRAATKIQEREKIRQNWLNCSLFYDAFSVTSLYSADDMLISEWWWMGKGLVGSGRGLI
jgi:hypothetical protein